ncbi:MAG: hypothetical protein HXS46_05900 [Theionarchaea archaeon]|nr:hypothetical protein [Theionarchaea archaeon]
MCLIIRTIYKFNTVEAFERAVETVKQKWSNKLIRERVIYNETKKQLTWQNLQEELEKAKTTNPVTIHGLIAVENQ